MATINNIVCITVGVQTHTRVLRVSASALRPHNMHLHIDPYRKFTICSMFAIRMSLRLDISWWHRFVSFWANFDILFDLTRPVSSQPIDDGVDSNRKTQTAKETTEKRCFYIDEAILFYYQTVSVCVERVYAFMLHVLHCPHSSHILIDFVGFPFVFFSVCV